MHTRWVLIGFTECAYYLYKARPILGYSHALMRKRPIYPGVIDLATGLIH